MDHKPPPFARLLLVFACVVLLLAGVQLGMAIGEQIVAQDNPMVGTILVLSLLGLIGWALNRHNKSQG